MKKNNHSTNKKWLVVLIVACVAFVLYNVPKSDFVNQLVSGDETASVSSSAETNSVAASSATTDDQAVTSATATNNTVSNDDFYDDYRVEREKVRDQSLELLKSVIDDPNAASDAKKQAQEKEVAMAEHMEQELLIETLLAAKNIPNAVAFIEEDKVTVVIDAKLDDKKAAQLAEVVDGVTGIGYENVVIITREK